MVMDIILQPSWVLRRVVWQKAMNVSEEPAALSSV